jgi:hypothetical protein
MGNILTTVIGYNQTDVYVFKDTNNVITTMCRIQFLEVESTPSSVATDWVYSSVPNPLNPSKYDVTIEYKTNGIDLSAGYNSFFTYDPVTNSRTIIFTVNGVQYSSDIDLNDYIPSNYNTIDESRNAFFTAIANAMNSAYSAGNYSFNSSKHLVSDSQYTLKFSLMDAGLIEKIYGSVITSDITSTNSVLSDYTLPDYDPSVPTNLTTHALSLVTFSPVAFIFDSDYVIVTPSASDTNFTVTIVDTNTLMVNTAAFNDAIFRVTDIETEIYGYVRYDNGTIQSDVAVTRNEIKAVTTSKNFDNNKRVVIQSISLTKGRWLVEATGSFDCSAATQVHFWFDIGGLLSELTLVPQYRDSLRTFNSQSNSNMSITMQCEFFFEDSTLIYWCTTPDTEITSSIFSTTIPTPSTSNSFIDYAISPTTVPDPPPAGTNNAKITAISISGV